MAGTGREGRWLLTAWLACAALVLRVSCQELGMVHKFEAALERQVADGKAASTFLLDDKRVAALGYQVFGEMRNTSAGFAHFSTVRLSPTLFALLGLGPSASGLTLENITCLWSNGTDGTAAPFQGRLRSDTAESLHQPYVYTVIFCDVGPEGALPVPEEDKLAEQGVLRVTVGPDKLPDFVQDTNITLLGLGSPGPFPLDLLMCGPILHGTPIQESIIQWKQYHFYLGFDGLLLYDAGALSNATQKEGLQSSLGFGDHAIVEFSGQEQYPSWYHGQFLAINDCLYRGRNSASWVAFVDLDEYIVVDTKPPMPLKQLLQSKLGVPWLSMGSLPYLRECQDENVDLWDPQASFFAVEQIRYHKAEPECWEPKDDPRVCRFSLGRRKNLENPRRVEMTWIHLVRSLFPVPENSALPREGEHLRVFEQMHLSHFQGFTQNHKWCFGHGYNNLTLAKYSTAVSDTAQRAREAARTHTEEVTPKQVSRR